MHIHSHHGHDHDHDHGAEPGAAVSGALVRALWVTIVFMLIEAVGGYVANSLALVSDAAHMLTDVGAMLLSLFVHWVSLRPKTATMSFGYHRVEILGALGSGLMIWFIAAFLIYEAILRMAAPPDVNGPIVMIVASIGLGANLLSMRMLHSAKEHNLNVRAAYLHMLSDCLGSIGAVVAGAVLWWTHWRPIDPIITVAFSALMIFSSWDLVKESVKVLMESTPSGVDPDEVRQNLARIPGVQEVHDLHIWTVSSGRFALSVHLISGDSEKALTRAHEVLKEKFGIVHTTIQIEDPEKFSSDRCYDCTPG